MEGMSSSPNMQIKLQVHTGEVTHWGEARAITKPDDLSSTPSNTTVEEKTRFCKAILCPHVCVAVYIYICICVCMYLRWDFAM